MRNNDLETMWHEIHANTNEDYIINIEKVMNLKHSKVISKILEDQKLKIILYSIFIVIYCSLMIYAFAYLKIKLSFISIIPLALVGMFIFIKMTSEIIRLQVLTNTVENISIKDSAVLLRKKLKKFRVIDLIINLIFFYVLVIGTTIIFLKDNYGVKNLSPLFIVYIIILLLIPWILKYQHNQRYRGLYSKLNDSINFLDDAS